MAQIATGHDDEALDLVQEAMLKLVERYGTRDEAEWGRCFIGFCNPRFAIGIV